jgi:regulatory factor X
VVQGRSDPTRARAEKAAHMIHILTKTMKVGDSPDGVTAGAGQSGTASKRSSLNLDQLKVVGGPSLGGLDDKTPTAANVLAAAQGTGPTASSSSGFQQPAAIRRRSGVPGDPVFTVRPHQGGPLGQGPSPPGHNAGPQGLGQPPVPGAPGAGGQYSIRNLPTFPKIEEALGNAGSSPQGVAAREVWRWFEDHLDALMESARTFRFDQFELHLRTFWASLNGDHREVVHAPAVAGLMAKADAILYDVSVFSPYLNPTSSHPSSFRWKTCGIRPGEADIRDCAIWRILPLAGDPRKLEIANSCTYTTTGALQLAWIGRPDGKNSIARS